MNIDRVAAVIVTFQPDELSRMNIISLCNIFEKVYLIDNGSVSKDILIDLPKNCYVIMSMNNIGLAAALNLGILNAISCGYNWIATFDQDSLVGEKYLDVMLDAIRKTKDFKVGIFSPRYLDRHTGYVKSFAKNSKLKLEMRLKSVKTTMTSGSVINAAAFQDCGGFKDEMFIDQLDNEMCLRFRTKGFLILEHQGIFLEHSVGKAEERKLGKLTVRPSNHSAIRRYYMSRNRVVVYTRYLLFDPLFVLDDFLYSIREHIKIVLYEESKKEKIKMSFLGLIDGLHGKMGKYIMRGKDV